MKRPGMRRAVVVLMAALLLVVLGTGCTKYASEEDLQNLESQKQAALSAEKKVEQLQAEKSDLEKTVAQKQSELQKVEAEKATVAERHQMMMQENEAEMGAKDEMMKGDK